MEIGAGGCQRYPSKWNQGQVKVKVAAVECREIHSMEFVHGAQSANAKTTHDSDADRRRQRQRSR